MNTKFFELLILKRKILQDAYTLKEIHDKGFSKSPAVDALIYLTSPLKFIALTLSSPIALTRDLFRKKHEIPETDNGAHAVIHGLNFLNSISAVPDSSYFFQINTKDSETTDSYYMNLFIVNDGDLFSIRTKVAADRPLEELLKYEKHKLNGKYVVTHIKNINTILNYFSKDYWNDWSNKSRTSLFYLYNALSPIYEKKILSAVDLTDIKINPQTIKTELMSQIFLCNVLNGLEVSIGDLKNKSNNNAAITKKEFLDLLSNVFIVNEKQQLNDRITHITAAGLEKTAINKI